jgi:predicted nucleotidyltransferase
MRLTPLQKQSIHRIVEETLGSDARVLLFGSRLDDNARGGDVDLLIELIYPLANPAETAATVSVAVMRALGGRKVDVVLSAPNLPDQPIHRIAREQGALL